MKHIKVFENFKRELGKSFKNQHGESFSMKIEDGSVFIKGEDINTEYENLENVLLNTIFGQDELESIEGFVKKYKNKISTNKYKTYLDLIPKNIEIKYKMWGRPKSV